MMSISAFSIISSPAVLLPAVVAAHRVEHFVGRDAQHGHAALQHPRRDTIEHIGLAQPRVAEQQQVALFDLWKASA